MEVLWLRPEQDASACAMRNDAGHQRRNRGAARFNDQTGDFSVKRIAHRIQIAQSPQRIIDLQQWPVAVVAQSAKNFVWRAVQIDHLPATAQPLPVYRPQHGTTAGGQHTLMGLRQVINDAFFNIPKPLFAFTLKVFPDRTAQPLLDDLIGINEGKLKPTGELTPDGGFAGAGKAD